MSEQEEFEFRARLEAEQSPKQPSGYGLTENPGIVEQFAGGAKHAWDRAASGMASLFGDKSLQPLVQQGAQFVKETGPASTVGQIAGDIAMAVPAAGFAAQGGRLLSQALGRLPTALPVAAETAAMGGYGALTADEGRGAEGAAWGAGATLAGMGAMRALKGLVKPTDEARVLLDRALP